VELGKLFEHLQYDVGELACSTVAFTNALGWTRRETGQQSDAHMIFRDILTALQGQTSSSRSMLINEIFQSVLFKLRISNLTGNQFKSFFYKNIEKKFIKNFRHKFIYLSIGEFS
jgi:hypothetical protein